MGKTNWFEVRKKPVMVMAREVMPKETFTIKCQNCNGFGDCILCNGKRTEVVHGEIIETREGKLYAAAGRDYIIKGVEGELYPINKEIFKKTYEVV